MIAGLGIAFAVYKLPTDKKESENINLKYWIIFVVLNSTIIATRLLFGFDIRQNGKIMVTGISATLISLTLTPLLTQKTNKKTG